ncbi:hypothetical protein ASPCAL02280 [Aspergillus calidoustus]|uniref:Uncharacterized protein n=1 Tax=Aspergillus calidoustus TaxID=454130 RepID=A0A0U5GN61_ASPCI|nr:hypothetical protein ASPCAL02280 [Aspergillus calidoustus]
MVGAPDIITYVGVPLAVLGVLPIFYTCIRSILSLRSIRHVLKTNGLASTSITRGSLMSGIIEVEIPRRRITPLSRDSDPGYWTLNPHTISLPGGSWATLNWNELLTGRVLYRCQYKEELRVPPAEIVFEELVTFLLDRGAVPDPKGWRVLKSIGLWTPTGTVLLRAPVSASRGSPGAGAETVLRLAPPYDGDGILRLALNWRKEWDCRDVNSLPPFWMRLARPLCESHQRPIGTVVKQSDDEPLLGSPMASLLAEISELHRSAEREDLSDGVRFHSESGHVQTVYFETKGALTGKQHQPWHNSTPASAWFTWTAAALSQKSSTGLWNVCIPPEITTFATKSSIPGGVLVLLEILDGTAIPPFAEPPPDQSIDIMQRHRAFVEGQRQRAIEEKMPPAQAAEAARARMLAQSQSFHEQHVKSIQVKKEYEAKRVIGALNSMPLSVAVVAEKCRLYLVTENIIPARYTLDDLARAILYLMIVSSEAAKVITEVLEQWRSWAEKSGLNQQHLEYLKANKIWFCYASALLAVIEQAGHSEAQLSLDMMECLKIWHTVHLG